MSSADPIDADAPLNAQLESVSDLRARCLFRSALRTAGEVRRAAQGQRQLIPYLNASFYEMTMAQLTFEPELGRDTSVQVIALLESVDAARAFQGDFDERGYEHAVGWMSACAYDNLATHTAQLQGYNSPGMHVLINDGIAVCRRTGKLKCITCFREYATQVFRAADDLPMALHHARENAVRPPRHKGDDRRFVGGKDEVNLLVIAGDYPAAVEAAQRAVELAKVYHSPLSAGTEARGLLMTAATLAGRDDVLAAAATLPAADVPPDENPTQEWRDALLASLSGDPSAAIETLTRWDKRLSDAKCLDDWFETRLALIAAYRRAGQESRAAALAKQLAAKATAADDHLTLRRLAGAAAPTPDAPDAIAVVQPEGPGPLDPLYAALGAEIQQRLSAATGDGPPDLSPVRGRVLAIPPEAVDRVADATRLLHMMGFLAAQPGTDGRSAWDWAKRVAANHQRSAEVLALLGSLGDGLRQADESVADAIPAAELEGLFRRAMDLAPQQATAFGRAGLFFLRQGNDAEAERCLARSFRLDRTSSFIARELADLYGHTERPTDGLAVLDLCLREGPADAPDPEVLWKATLAAVSLGRWEPAVTYCSRLEQVQPDRRWVAYYRAVALVELKRFPAAAVAIEREAGLIRMPTALHVHTIRAAAAAGLGDADSVRRHVDAAVRPPLSSVDYMSRGGVVGCFTRLWTAAKSLADDDTVRARLTERLLASGLTPKAFWDDGRAGGQSIDGLTHFWCDVRQPVDERWAAAGHALPDAAAWTAYRIRYGVLAADADDAAARAVAWQRRSAVVPPIVESVTANPGTYTDAPGVTNRGYPEAVEP